MALLPKRQYLRDDSSFVFLTPNDILQALLPSSGPGSYPVPSGPNFIRNLLTSATNFYYKPSTGSDTLNDGSIFSPWASPAPLYKFFDFGNQSVTLNLQENTTTQLDLLGWTGDGSLTIDLGGHTLNFAGVQSTDGAVIADHGTSGPVTLQNGTIECTTGTSTLFCSTLWLRTAATVIIGTGLTLGPASFAKIHANLGGCTVKMLNTFHTSGGAAALLYGNGGLIANFGVGMSIIFDGDATYTDAVVHATGGGSLIIPGRGLVWNTGGHIITGTKYLADLTGVINGQGNLGNIPGSVAGSFTPPGIAQ